MKKGLSTLALLTSASLTFGQMTVDDDFSPAWYVQNVLLGAGVTASNITYNGQAGTTPSNQVGRFYAPGTNLQLDSGVVLSSGLVVSDPNNFVFGANGNVTDFAANSMGTFQSDPDLVLLSGQSINDAAVLEFDFVPIGDSIKFRYVFGSEEYPGYTCSSFNDAFGFFLSGPGINGPYTNNAINIALVPGTNIPISINTVNSGVSSSGVNTLCDQADPNWQANSIYFVDNAAQAGVTVTYDGFTTVLTAFSIVQCGQPYHIKLAIGDGTDQTLDSGVFLEGGSFTSPPFVPSLQPGPGIVGTNTILESCFDVDFIFTRNGDSTNAATIQIETSGTATAGVDYVPPFPSEITFAPLQTEVHFSLNAPMDVDGPESLIINVISPSNCTADTLNIPFTFVIDAMDPLIAIGDAFLIDCGESVQLTPTVTGGFGAYGYQWSVNGASTDTSILYTPTQVQDVTVLITDSCGLSTTGFFAVELTQPPPITASLTGPDPMVEGCDAATITIHRPAGTSGDLLITTEHTGTASQGADYSITSPIIISGNNPTVTAEVTPLEDNSSEGEESVVITAAYTNACQQAVTATVSTDIIDADPIELTSLSPVVIACGSDSVPLLAEASGGVGSLDYLWSNGYTGPTSYVSNSLDGIYNVTVTDDCNHTRTAQVIVDPQCEIVIPNVISPNGDGDNDYFYIQGILASRSTVRIFNRWGQVVFEQVNYQNNWAAADLPDGTYFYEVKVDSKPDPYVGNVTVLKNRR